VSGQAAKKAVPSRKAADKDPTPAPAREDTVAEEGAGAPAKEAVAEPTFSSDVPSPEDTANPPDTAPVPEEKRCVTCGGPGEYTTDFPWMPPQTFCRRDTPPQYRRYVNK
jgi:hypothetical protein